MTVGTRGSEVSDASGQASEAVRKQVTVLFCDIANYTERTAAMDPEELGDEIRQFQQICRKIAETYRGNVSSYHGDGVMILFGHPVASEFSPERAVRAGLDMVAAIQRNNNSPDWKDRHPLAIRIGIATGLVVVGDRAGEQQDQAELIFGNATNLAARLQDIAKPNTVVAALRTRRLVGLAFKFRELGEFDLKGFTNPVSAWQILHERKLSARSGNILKRNTAQFISRQSELASLHDSFRQACHGFGRFVHVRGDPGIGKTRLVRVFEKSLPQDDIHCMRITCSPYYQTSSLRPVSDECLRWLRISDNDDLETRQASVSWAMSIVELDPTEKSLVFTELLGIPPPEGAPDLDMSPDEKRQRTIRALATIIVAVSELRPLLLIAEDLHWADPSTLEMLQVLMAQGAGQRILGIFTSRQPYALPWPTSDAMTELALGGFTEAESGELIEGLFGDHYLPESLKQNLIHKCDGVPLYLEECCLSALSHLQRSEDGSAPLSHYAVPETLQDSLNARLDRLGEARSLAQLASVFAEDFTWSVISAIARMNNIDADAGIDILLDQNILVQETAPNEDRIKFRHVLFQEAAYQSLLIKVRQHYHLQIAELLTDREPRIAERCPELLAHHFSRTSQTAPAVTLWLQASTLAIEKSAMAEAVDHLQNGLSLVRSLDDGNLQDTTELSLLLNLGVALTARAGYFSEEVKRTYQRAVVLAERVGNQTQQWTALYGLWRCHISRADYATGIRIGATLDRLAVDLDDPILRLTTCGIKGMNRLVDGKLASASRYTDRAVDFYQAVTDKRIGQRFGQDPFVTIQGLGGVAKLLSGRISDSVADINRSVDVARSIGHPYTIAETLKLAAMYEQIARNLDRMHAFSVEAIELSERHGFEGILATHRMFVGFAELVADDNPAAVDKIRHNLLVYEQKYGLLFLPYFQSVLAEALLVAGQHDEAVEIAALMLEAIDRSGENWIRPKALYIMAEASIKSGSSDREHINAWYAQSLEIAAGQGSLLMLGRALEDRHHFDLGTADLEHYQRLLAALDEQETMPMNHAFITRRH